MQIAVGAFFYTREREWGLKSATEQRVRIAPGIFRIPDICLLPEAPEGDYVIHPPVIAIEILSSDESAKELSEKIVEYLDFGVEAVWGMDPVERNGIIYPRDGHLRRDEDGVFVHGRIAVHIRELG